MAWLNEFGKHYWWKRFKEIGWAQIRYWDGIESIYPLDYWYLLWRCINGSDLMESSISFIVVVRKWKYCGNYWHYSKLRFRNKRRENWKKLNWGTDYTLSHSLRYSCLHRRHRLPLQPISIPTFLGDRISSSFSSSIYRFPFITISPYCAS